MSTLDEQVKSFDVTADAMRADLRAAGWTEINESADRWRSPDRRLSLRLAAAWQAAWTDVVGAWRGGSK